MMLLSALIASLSLLVVNCQQSPTKDVLLATSFGIHPTQSEIAPSLFFELQKNDSITINTILTKSSTAKVIILSTAKVNVSSTLQFPNITPASMSMHSTAAVSTLNSASPSNMSQSIHPSTSLSPVVSNMSQSIHPATMTSLLPVVVSSSIAPTYTTPGPRTVTNCGKECELLKKRLYTSAVFAILFLIVSIVLIVLLYRQYRISKEYQNDPSLSRLI